MLSLNTEDLFERKSMRSMVMAEASPIHFSRILSMLPAKVRMIINTIETRIPDRLGAENFDSENEFVDTGILLPDEIFLAIVNTLSKSKNTR